MPVSYKITLGKRFDLPENSHDLMIELENYFLHALKSTTQTLIFPSTTSQYQGKVCLNSKEATLP